MILLNQVIQVLAGPDERLSGQDAFGLQFGDGLKGRPAAVECDLLRALIIGIIAFTLMVCGSKRGGVLKTGLDPRVR